ncbi:HtaA domain-containing protein [Leucobacter sp. NPDC015123]|uniref:HtaA domain-containing protein n=1 Tax=Leucobacter sp. NPDC015123 TaxID=3364129 RepID=UPI0036F482AB
MTRRTACRALTAGLTAALLGGALASASAMPALARPTEGGALHTTAATAGECAVGEAELRWGVKERFRNYISGSIAGGEWVTEGGVTYETPQFTWPSGTGGVREDLSGGAVTFPGSIHFTGHGGLMQLDLRNPQIVFTSPKTAELVLEMAASDVEGGELVFEPVTAANIDIAGAHTGDGSSYLIEAAPVHLTEAGAAAFNNKYGDYSPGETFDALAVSLTLPGCAITVSTGTAAPPEEEVLPGDPAGQAGPEIPWAIVALGGVALVGIGVTTVLLLRGRKPEK